VSSRDSKLNSSTKKRLIHYDLVKVRNTRKTQRDESIFEIVTKLLNSCWNL